LGSSPVFFMNSRLLRLAQISVFFSALLPLSAAERIGRGDSPRLESHDGGPLGDYILQPQDVLRVLVFQHDDLNKQSEAISISKEHTVNLPLIRTVNLKGKTARQAEEMIRAAYDKDYLVNPQVTVTVLKYAERSVNIVGAVNTPGRIQFPQERGLTIVDAITLAGGPNRYADMRKVQLTRTKASGETITEVINVQAMMTVGGREAIPPLPLQKDDSILVPEKII
jgi:protein involved in polysaccharide export with SLBB domain